MALYHSGRAGGGGSDFCRDAFVAEVLPPKDAKALADAMERYLALTAEEKRAFSLHSRKKAEEVFDIRRVYDVYLEILRQAL